MSYCFEFIQFSIDAYVVIFVFEFYYLRQQYFVTNFNENT
jgi:hypothetical protein